MITERPPGLKWNYFEPDVLPAWVAEMDFGIAPPVAAALHEAVDRGDTGYLYPSATLDHSRNLLSELTARLLPEWQ